MPHCCGVSPRTVRSRPRRGRSFERPTRSLMSVRVWDGNGPVLADTSAWMQARRERKARRLLLGAIERGDLCWCWPVCYELMVDAKGPEGIAAVERTLEGLREV